MRNSLVWSRLARNLGALLSGVAPCVEHGPNLLFGHRGTVSEHHHEQDGDVRWADLPVIGVGPKMLIDAMKLCAGPKGALCGNRAAHECEGLGGGLGAQRRQLQRTRMSRGRHSAGAGAVGTPRCVAGALRCRHTHLQRTRNAPARRTCNATATQLHFFFRSALQVRCVPQLTRHR